MLRTLIENGLILKSLSQCHKDTSCFFLFILLKILLAAPISDIQFLHKSTDNFKLFLNRFSPIFYFNTPRKSQKAKGFVTFSGGIEMERGAKMSKIRICYWIGVRGVFETLSII